MAYAWRVGRKDLLLTAPTYTVPPRMRRLLWERDQGCRFCGRKSWLHHHHITAWPHGPTELSNLVLVCRWHPRLIHDKGWSIRGTPEPGGTLELLNPYGAAVLAA